MTVIRWRMSPTYVLLSRLIDCSACQERERLRQMNGAPGKVENTRTSVRNVGKYPKGPYS